MWSDPNITPLNSINYYEGVLKAQRDAGHELTNTLEFYRLFMAPGMWHCGGGPGATSLEMIRPLEQRVERGNAPDRVLASRVRNGVVMRTRPLCHYPPEAQWKGTGSTDDAANFACALPKTQQLGR